MKLRRIYSQIKWCKGSLNILHSIQNTWHVFEIWGVRTFILATQYMCVYLSLCFWYNELIFTAIMWNQVNTFNRPFTLILFNTIKRYFTCDRLTLSELPREPQLPHLIFDYETTIVLYSVYLQVQIWVTTLFILSLLFPTFCLLQQIYASLKEVFRKKTYARYLIHLCNFSAVCQWDLCEISISIYVFSTFQLCKE